MKKAKVLGTPGFGEGRPGVRLSPVMADGVRGIAAADTFAIKGLEGQYLDGTVVRHRSGIWEQYWHGVTEIAAAAEGRRVRHEWSGHWDPDGGERSGYFNGSATYDVYDDGAVNLVLPDEDPRGLTVDDLAIVEDAISKFKTMVDHPQNTLSGDRLTVRITADLLKHPSLRMAANLALRHSYGAESAMPPRA